MPVISFRVTPHQEQLLKEKAREEHISLKDYILISSLPEEIQDETNKLTHEEVLRRIENQELHSGMKFSIPDLFSEEEWSRYTNTVSLGRTFRMAEKQENSLVAEKVKFVDKKDGYPAVYEVK